MPSRNQGRVSARWLAISAASAVGLGALTFAPAAQALTSVSTSNGATVYINDARRPGLDTGSIRDVSDSLLEGFGNIFVHIDTPADEEPRMNDQMMRGFGLTAGAAGSYTSTKSVRLGDVLMTRLVQVSSASSSTSFFDTFTNTATEPVTLEVSFGGSLGNGLTATTSPNKATVSDSSSGDAVVDTGDTWITATTPGATRPTGVVVGSGVASLADQQSNPFTTAYVPTGSRANDLGFVRELTIEPGATESLMQYAVIGAVSDTSQIVTDTAALAATPDFSNLTLDEICTLQNWDLASYDEACVGAEPLKLPAADIAVEHTTKVAYDVTGKTIAQLQADMTAGIVTSVEITKAYLDRIDAYDGGSLGFNSFITVAQNAVAQAMAADRARADGDSGGLLGVPIALKDLYDTEDMPTSGGTLALEDWEPGKDAWQVSKLRADGAVIIGKANLSEFANSGSFSESGFKQTWNALYPSKTSFGSSGGSATAVAADLAAGAMGTQTGVSLYAPSTGASLSTFRGTDGLTSTNGVMPLTWATDYAGPMAKSVTDLAIMLDAIATQSTGNDPDDLLTSRVDNSLRPVEWQSSLRSDALQGRVIGYVPTAFESTRLIDDAAGAVALADATAAIEAAGGTLVPLAEGAATAPTAPPSGDYPTTGNAGAEGWERYIAEERPGTFPYTTKELRENQANLPYHTSTYTAEPMDDVSVENLLARRDAYKINAADWMDSAFGDAPVDAVIYPGFLTSVGNNDSSSAIMSSDRASGVITQSVGLPTAILPVGENEEGQSNNIQIVGRAWQDADVLGMGYALEQQADAVVQTTFAPALAWSGPAESVTSLSLASTATTYGTSATAIVSVDADPAATGSVSVEVNGSTVTGSLSGGTARLRLPADLSVGTHLVTAAYGGSAKVSPSVATATLKVVKAAPKVSVEADEEVGAVGQAGQAEDRDHRPCRPRDRARLRPLEGRRHRHGPLREEQGEAAATERRHAPVEGATSSPAPTTRRLGVHGSLSGCCGRSSSEPPRTAVGQRRGPRGPRRCCAAVAATSGRCPGRCRPPQRPRAQHMTGGPPRRLLLVWLGCEGADDATRGPAVGIRRPRGIPDAGASRPGRQRLRDLPGPHHEPRAALARRRGVGPVLRRRPRCRLSRGRQPGADRGGRGRRPSLRRAGHDQDAQRVDHRRPPRRRPDLLEHRRRHLGTATRDPVAATPSPDQRAAAGGTRPGRTAYRSAGPAGALPGLRRDVHRGGRRLPRGGWQERPLPGSGHPAGGPRLVVREVRGRQAVVQGRGRLRHA